MAENSDLGFQIYRNGRRPVAARVLVRELEHALARLIPECNEERLLTALLRAGELECALSDADSPDNAVALTDEIAAVACRNGSAGQSWGNGDAYRARKLLSQIRFEGELPVSRPEGFAYYALHPVDFAGLISNARLAHPSAFVIGIRSIGTTLSAIVQAQLACEGVSSSRTTVRPFGHPYDRRSEFTSGQRQDIRLALARGAVFLVCDEGPGRSGSSFISVAEALEREGVRREDIVLLCSHHPDVDSLCADNAQTRWRRYKSIASGLTKHIPAAAGAFLGGGEWRRHFVPPGRQWPATWPQMERLKYLSLDGQHVLKFEGHGPYGDIVREREELLTESGFGSPYRGHKCGFGCTDLVKGPGLRARDASAGLLGHMARYCWWRSEALGSNLTHDDVQQLEFMAAGNLQQEFGWAPALKLQIERPTVCDGRMQPGKWQVASSGSWIKLDASTHGDDHFFPGPCDIAWDLAALCIEWDLSTAGRTYFISEYRRISYDDPERRLADYELAYAAFRLGWSRMAAASVQGNEDEPRLLAEHSRYQAILGRLLASRWRPTSSTVPATGVAYSLQRRANAGCGSTQY
jgi:hypothetical protein